MLHVHHRFSIEQDARTKRKLPWVAAIPVILRLQIDSRPGTELIMDVNLGQKFSFCLLLRAWAPAAHANSTPATHAQ